MEINLPFPQEAAERFDALYQLLSRKYNVEQSTIKIDSGEYRIISVRDMDELLDRLIRMNPEEIEVKDERLPYWAEIWPASLAMCNFLNRQAILGKGQKVLELGCGLGLVGMVAARQGADVLLTDYQPDALRFAELNWLLNIGEAPATHLMDWRNPDLSGKFDIILASDVAYEKRFFWPLIDTFRDLLNPGGHIYLSEPNRTIARRFFEMLKDDGFALIKHDAPVIYRDKKQTVAVYDIRR